MANEGLQGFPTKNVIFLVVTVSGWGVDLIYIYMLYTVYIYIYLLYILRHHILRAVDQYLRWRRFHPHDFFRFETRKNTPFIAALVGG